MLSATPSPDGGPTTGAIDTHAVSPADAAGLAALFSALVAAADEQRFHPHPLTAAYAAYITSEYAGADRYFVATSRSVVVGYGMLRGWDEGFAIPSLGIAVHPAWRGRGVARTLMTALHHDAQRLGAPSIRLRVHPDNATAISLYRNLGYEFAGEENGQLVASFQLDRGSQSR